MYFINQHTICLQPLATGPPSPPKWVADFEKEDMEMIQGNKHKV